MTQETEALITTVGRDIGANVVAQKIVLLCVETEGKEGKKKQKKNKKQNALIELSLLVQKQAMNLQKPRNKDIPKKTLLL